ncbi:MAG TPA: hypothetical protein VE093_44215 [Polyangiaceae bacterium]|nr:hypothetical protein [Polyangiaceae bacterium]
MNRRERTGISGARAAFALLLALVAGCAQAGGAPREEPGCAVARVGDDVVTVADADVVRAVVQPPLTRGEAKRLAVSATAAYRRLMPRGLMAGMDERLAVYRQAVHHGAELDTLPVQPGACWDGPPRP